MSNKTALVFLEDVMEQVTATGSAFTLIHFVYPLSDTSPAEYRIACMPNMTEFHQTKFHLSYQRTDQTTAVTCPACKRTETYEKARRRNG